MNTSEKNWYILYTKPGCEKKVSNLLTRKNIENYFPLKRTISSRKRYVLEPLFNSYVFVKQEEKNLPTLRMLDGVLNYAYWLGKPAVVKNEEIDLIRLFLNEYSSVNLEKLPFNVQGNLRIVGETENAVASVKNNMVKIILPSIGYYLVAELEKANIEIITAKKQSFGILERFQFAV